MVRSLDGFIVYSFPALVLGSIEHLGWRETMRWLAALIAVSGTAAAWMLSDTPEEMGLLPDGEEDEGTGRDAGEGDGGEKGGRGTDRDGSDGGYAAANSSSSGGGHGSATTEPVWDYADAVREPFLYKLIAADATGILFFTGVNVHILDIFESRGLAKAEVAGLSMWMSAGLLLGQLSVGSRLDGLKKDRRKDLLCLMYVLVLLTQLWFLRPAGGVGALQQQQRASATDLVQLHKSDSGHASRSRAAASLWYFMFGFAFGGVIMSVEHPNNPP